MKDERDWPLWAALAILIGGLLLSVAAPAIGGDPLVHRLDRTLLPPGSPGHLLGTDNLGRDVLSRLLHGGRSSYLVAIGSAVIAGVIGTTVGMVAGVVTSRALDRGLQILNDGILAFPTILLAVTISLIFGAGRLQVMWTLGIVYAPVVYRVARLETRRVVVQDFYRVSRMMGTGPLGRTVLHILPSVLPSVIVQLASLAALAIGTEAALSFLGLGTQPPEPSWGLMLNDARRYMVQAPQLALFPGIAAGILAFSLQFSSDRLAVRTHRGA
jgi:ABC-type dipeptide/oligopeptide/nickel transport system permease subunit